MSLTAAAIAAGASLIGGRRSNVANAKEAAKNRDFQADMSNTSYQRSVADMKAAGLSPMLAYQKGGASTPSGSQASQSDEVTPAVNSALSARMNEAAVEQAQAQTRKTDAEAKNQEIAGRLMESQIQNNVTSAQLTAGHVKQLDLLALKLQSEIDLNASNRAYKSLDYNRLLKEIDQMAGRYHMDMAEKDAAIKYLSAKTGIVNYSLAGARNQSALDESWYGRKIRPVLGDVGTVLNSAGKAKYLFGGE